MIQFAESVQIDVEPARVWRALTVPDEVVCWDTGIIEPIDAPLDYPCAGQHVRWRYRFGPLPLILHDRPSRVEALSILRSSIRLGPFDFDETYTLVSDSSSSTRLTAAMSVSSTIPVIGGLLERVVGGPLASSTVRTSLAAIKVHCEETP
ncbi:MAG: hypothetical protein GY725_16645 [bacterium]|nr:hypothetical protein [bacterium]